MILPGLPLFYYYFFFKGILGKHEFKNDIARLATTTKLEWPASYSDLDNFSEQEI